MLSRKKLKFIKKRSKDEGENLKTKDSNSSKNSEKLEKIQKFLNLSKNYQKIKFKQDFYSIGDNLMVRDLNECFLVAKLVRIISTGGNRKYPYWPTIEVEW
jgi:hypothetical protein